MIGAASSYLESRIGSENNLTHRALSFAFGDSILKQGNREKIAKLAIEDFRSNQTKDTVDAKAEIEDDWLNTFTELSSLKSNVEIQVLWGKILAGKIRQPSSFSLQSLHLLSRLDTNDARLIHEMLGNVISLASPFIYKSPMWGDISQFIHCEDLGIISSVSGNINTQLNISEAPPHFKLIDVKIIFSGVEMIMTVPRKNLSIPSINVTRFGRELITISEGLKVNEQYLGDFIDYLKIQGGAVKKRSDLPGLRPST